MKPKQNDENYIEKYDAYFDPDENTWIEDKCGNKECEFCSKRPPTPKQTKKENKKYPYRKLNRRIKNEIKNK